MLKFTIKAFLAGVAIATPLLGASITANSQAMSPMRKVIVSYTDQFAVKVYPQNPYQHRIKMEVRVYDENFQLTPAHVSPQSMLIAGGASRPVTVIVPFQGVKQKRVRICTESIPYQNQPTLIKVRVCGKFLAKRGN